MLRPILDILFHRHRQQIHCHHEHINEVEKVQRREIEIMRNLAIADDCREPESSTGIENHYTNMRDDDNYRNEDNPASSQHEDETPYKMCCCSFEYIRESCGSFVNDDRFQMLMVALICINGIIMGLTTFDFVAEDEGIEEYFERIDKAFLIIFTMELGLQMIYNGTNMFLDGWNLFDFVIICLSWVFNQIQVVRAFRIFRVLKLISHVKAMREIVIALLTVIPRMLTIGVLLNIVMYIFGVMLTHLFKNVHSQGLTSYPYFVTLGNTMFTLFQMMTLDGWSEICQEVQVAYPWAWLPIISYVIISAFIMVNLIIAVICDAIADLQFERLRKERELAKENFKRHDDSHSDAKTVETDNESDPKSTNSIKSKADEMRFLVEQLETDIILLASYQEQTKHMVGYLIGQIQSKDC